MFWKLVVFTALRFTSGQQLLNFQMLLQDNGCHCLGSDCNSSVNLASVFFRVVKSFLLLPASFFRLLWEECILIGNTKIPCIIKRRPSFLELVSFCFISLGLPRNPYVDEEIFPRLKLAFHRRDALQPIAECSAGEIAQGLLVGNNFEKLLFTVFQDSLSLFALSFAHVALN